MDNKEQAKPNSGLVFSRESVERWYSQNKSLADSESVRLRFGFQPPSGQTRLEPSVGSDLEEESD